MSSDTYIGGVRDAHKIVTDKVSRFERLADELRSLSRGDLRYNAAIFAIVGQASLLKVVACEIINLSTEGPDAPPSPPVPEAPPAA